MHHIDVRPVADAARVITGDLASLEPSHIHIPRPSRGQRGSKRQHDDQPPALVQLELTLDEAA